MVAPFAWLAVYAHPAADDFPLSQTAREWGQYTTVVGYWKCWSARYTSIFLMSVNPLVFGSLWGYKAGFFVNFFIVAIALYLFIKVFFQLESKQTSWLLAITVALVLVSTSPTLSNGYYYLAGAWFYLPGHLLLAIFVWFVTNTDLPENLQQLRLRQIINLSFVSCLLVLLIGCNEVMMLISLAFVGLSLFWFLVFEKKLHIGWLFILFVALASTALVVFSPASFYRMEASGSMERTFVSVSGGAFKALWNTVYQSALSLPLFAAMAAGFVLPVSSISTLGKPKRMLISLTAILVFYLAYFPSMVGEGLVQARTEVTFQFLLVVMVWLNMALWRSNSGSKANENFILLALLTLIPFGKNYMPAWNDLLTGAAKTYNHERNARIACLQQTKGDSVWVNPVSVKPVSLFVGDVGDYPQPWYDNHVAIYYGKKFIHLVNEEHPQPSCP